MIGSLRGIVLSRQMRTEHSAEVLIELGGVGYRVITPSSALQHLGQLGSPAFLHVHTHVREDALILYGFGSREERACFEVLIGAHGVGPAVALALLSVHSPAALQRAVLGDDVDALMLVPGVGRKTATRLIVELKSRLDLSLEDVDLSAMSSGGAGGGVPDQRADVRAALAGLGYAADEIRHALTRLPAEGTSEDLLRVALRELADAR